MQMKLGAVLEQLGSEEAKERSQGEQIAALEQAKLELGTRMQTLKAETEAKVGGTGSGD